MAWVLERLMSDDAVKPMDNEFWEAIPDVLSIDQVAAIVRRSRMTLYRWLGASPAKMPGHHIANVWIVYKEQLRRWLEHPDHPIDLPHEFLSRYPEDLRADQLAELVGMTQQTVYKWLDKGDLVGQRVSGEWAIGRVKGTWVLKKSDLIATLRRQSAVPIPEADDTDH